MYNSQTKFQKCLQNRQIIPFAPAKNLVNKELSEALADLEEAQDRFNLQRYKYCTTTAYYAMFHAARALLYSQGFREKSHICIIAAIEELFAKTDLMEMRFVRALSQAMTLRHDADYAAEYSQEGATQALEDAREFIRKAQELLNN